MAGPTTFSEPIERYKASGAFLTALDPLSDLLLHLQFLNSRDYVTSLLRSVHGVSKQDALARAPSIAAHVRLADQFFQQAGSGPRDVAFVSYYYGILNLMKIYILFTPLHGQLADNRHHGASYRTAGGPGRSLPKDSVQVAKKGAIPLFYETITAAKFVPQTVRLGDVYPYIQDVGAEWQLAIRSDRIGLPQ